MAGPGVHLEFTEAIAGLLEERIAQKPTSQEGEYEYAIEDLGLTDERVRETLKAYNERFGVWGWRWRRGTIVVGRSNRLHRQCRATKPTGAIERHHAQLAQRPRRS